MEYLKKSFSLHAPSSPKYKSEHDRIFRAKKKESPPTRRQLSKAFSVVEGHDVKVANVYLTGSKRQQKRTLRDLKKWSGAS